MQHASIHAERPRITRGFVHARRVGEISLAACALFGIAHSRGPIDHPHQDIVMGHLDELFGWTAPEGVAARDMLFEGTLNHAICESDRPRILKCAMALANIAASYDGDDRPIWAAGFELFEIDSLWEAANPSTGAPRHDPAYDGGDASLRFWGRI